MNQPLRQVPALAPELPGQPAPRGNAPVPLLRRWDRRTLLMFVGVLAVWLFARPWNGLWHDGRLYAVQALHRLQPAQFDRDLFFLFGSQDTFTLFSPLYAGCIEAFGLEAAARLLQVLGSLLWLGSAAFLLMAFRRGVWPWLCLACLLLLPSDYDPVRALGLAEPFLTPRIFGEAIGMLAIGCLLRGWRWLAAAALVLGFLIHPLMLAVVALFALCYHAGELSRPPLLLAMVAAAAATVAAAVLGIVPFARLFQSMDPEWYAQVVQLTPIVGWDSWHFDEMASRTTVSFCLVLVAGCLSSGWRARFYWSVAAAGGAGLLASWIGTSLFHNLLLLQLQPWRTLWLVQLGAGIALLWLAAAFWERGRVFRVLLLALGVAVLTRDTYGGLLAMVAGLGLAWQGRRATPLELPARQYGLLLLAVAVLALGWLAQADRLAVPSAWVMHWNYADPESTASLRIWALLRLGGAALLGSAVLLSIWRLAGLRRPAGWLAAAVLASAALAAALGLSGNYQAQQAKMSPAAMHDVQAGFVPLIPPQATVYWHGDVARSWFLLRRAGYASRPQMFGMVFNRGTAIEGRRRLERLQQLGNPDALFGLPKAERSELAQRLPAPGAAGLAYVCADPALDFVVLEQRLAAGLVAQARDPVFKTGYYLYDCSRLRGLTLKEVRNAEKTTG
jgi:hypothetical protein